MATIRSMNKMVGGIVVSSLNSMVQAAPREGGCRCGPEGTYLMVGRYLSTPFFGRRNKRGRFFFVLGLGRGLGPIPLYVFCRVLLCLKFEKILPLLAKNR